jgi:hypothetical protein
MTPTILGIEARLNVRQSGPNSSLGRMVDLEGVARHLCFSMRSPW